MPGKKWTPHEINLLRKLAKKGFSPQRIFESGQLPGRSFHAIERQLKRLSYGHHKNFHGNHVKAEDIAELDEIIRLYANAFRQICEEGEFSRDEIDRFKVIFQAAAKYRELFLAYAEVKMVDERLAEFEKVVEELQAQISSRKSA